MRNIKCSHYQIGNTCLFSFKDSGTCAQNGWNNKLGENKLVEYLTGSTRRQPPVLLYMRVQHPPSEDSDV
jgi:hypothetical protein